MADTSLTKPQLAAYWRAASAAAREVSEPLEEYRKRVMSEECGVSSVKALNRTGDFDKVMARFAVDAGDYASAAKFASSPAALRLRHVIVASAEILAPGHTLNYVAGLMIQSGIVQGGCGDRQHLASRLASDSIWESIVPDDLRRLLAMLKTHIRRRRKTS